MRKKSPCNLNIILLRSGLNSKRQSSKRNRFLSQGPSSKSDNENIMQKSTPKQLEETLTGWRQRRGNQLVEENQNYESQPLGLLLSDPGSRQRSGLKEYIQFQSKESLQLRDNPGFSYQIIQKIQRLAPVVVRKPKIQVKRSKNLISTKIPIL